MTIMSARKNDTGRSRSSYRNGRVLLCRGREHPLPDGAPKVVGGGDAWLVVIQRPDRLASSPTKET
jgi:hypothetical protein